MTEEQEKIVRWLVTSAAPFGTYAEYRNARDPKRVTFPEILNSGGGLTSAVSSVRWNGHTIIAVIDAFGDLLAVLWHDRPPLGPRYGYVGFQRPPDGGDSWEYIEVHNDLNIFDYGVVDEDCVEWLALKPVLQLGGGYAMEWAQVWRSEEAMREWNPFIRRIGERLQEAYDNAIYC